MKKIKKKLPFIIFVLCFLPYVLILAMSVYYAFAGYEIRTFVTGELIETFYGLEAFCRCATAAFEILWYVWIIPLCLIYQAVYLFVRFYLCDKMKNSD